jgi:hypothetical protein
MGNKGKRLREDIVIDDVYAVGDLAFTSLGEDKMLTT